MSVVLDSTPSSSTAVAGAAAAGRIPATPLPKATPASHADLAAANEVYHQHQRGASEETERGRSRPSGDRAGRSGAAAALPKTTTAAAPPPPPASSSASSSHANANALPPLPRLFPAQTMTSSQVSGEWQLVASSAASWRARRNVRARFTPRTTDDAQASASSDDGGGDFGSGASLDAEWIFYEIASFQAKTLVQRVSEDVKAKKAARLAERRRREGKARGDDEEEEDEDLQQRSGERTVSVSGRMWEERGSKCFAYRPNRPTLQKAMGKDVHWEVVSYGTASPVSPGGHSPASTTISRSSIDWFVAYAHPLPFWHPFISVYFRPEVVRDRPDTVNLLFEDIVDVLRHATDIWGEDEGGEENEEQNGVGSNGDGDASRPESLAHKHQHQHHQPHHHRPRRGRRRERNVRGSGDGDHRSSVDSDDDYMPVTGTGPSGAPLTSLSASVSRGGKKGGGGGGVKKDGADQTPSKEERRREDLRWELRRMAPEVRPVRGI